MSIRAAGGGVRLGDKMTVVKVLRFPGPDGGRWVLCVNGFIIKLDADERIIREAAAAYFIRGEDPVRASA